MEQVPSPEHVIHAIDTLYCQSDPSAKEGASKWLEEFQRSAHAWEISDTLLRMQRNQQTSYFAAQTMRTKVQYHFAELPLQSHMMLMNSILDHLETVNTSSNATVTQLCLAVADLAVQCVSWNNPVNDILTRLGSKSNFTAITLEILMVLPEEASRDIMKVGANRRAEFTQLLRNCSEEVWKFLIKCSESNQLDEKSQCKLFQTVGSWLTLRALPPQLVATSALFQSAFQLLIQDNSSTELHDAATECICNALYICEDMNTQMPLASACFSYVSMLSPAFEKAMKEEDLDKELNFARIFSEMAESFLPVIIKTPGEGPGSLSTLDMLISCAENKKYEVVEVTFNFWYRFAESIYQEPTERLKQLFYPYIQRLLVALCRHCAMESTHDGLLQTSDEFFDFRLRLSELLQDVVFIVGSGPCFNQVLHGITQNGLQWNVLEGSLFMLSSIIKNLDGKEKSIGNMLQLIVSLPNETHIAVHQSALHLAGDASFWINENNQFVDNVFQYILTGFQNKKLCNEAALALEKFCVQCSMHLAKHYGVLIQVCKALDEIGLHQLPSVGIIKGTAAVLSKLPFNEISGHLNELCTICIEPLQKLCAMHESGASKSQDPVTALDRLSAVFRDISVTIPEGAVHPCQAVVSNIWPTLSKIGIMYQTDERIMERYCRCLRYAIRCVGQASITLLQPLVQQIVTLYKSCHHSCFIYLASILVDEYGAEESCQPGLIAMLEAFSAPAFQILSKQNGLQSHPDTVDDFFRLCNRFLLKCPVPFLRNPSMATVQQLAVAATVLDHREANGAVMKYLCDFIRCGSSHKESPQYPMRNELIRNQLNSYGQQMVKALIDATAGGIQVFMVPEVVEVYWELVNFNREVALKWLEQALSSLPPHSATGMVQSTPQQRSEFYDACKGAQAKPIFYRSFRGFARLYR